MENITLTIDNRTQSVPAGSTILAAAAGLGISIPTLCYLEGSAHRTSCMLCLVLDKTSGRLLPACSALAENGMRIETANPQIRRARQDTLELLLSEHAGDCEAPCSRACPAGLDIPGMIRGIRAGRWQHAFAIVQQAIPFPGVLGRICPAPCEKACHRAKADSPLAICLLKRWVGDKALEHPLPEQAVAPKAQRIAIVGAGPAGLTAAFYLSRLGFPCTLFDNRQQPGGSLLTAVSAERLPRGLLQQEITAYLGHSVSFRQPIQVGRELSLAELRRDYAAVILCPGRITAEAAGSLGVAFSQKGIGINPADFMTEQPGVFAGGAAVKAMRMAVSAVAHGRQLARAVENFLEQTQLPLSRPRSVSMLSALNSAELAEYMQLADNIPRMAAEENGAFGGTAARAEAGRCLQCDCAKIAECRLRAFSLACQADQRRFGRTGRLEVKRIRVNQTVFFEPGKCIKCGRCIHIAAARRPGLTFLGRGSKLQVGVPFDQSFAEGLGELAAACAAICPTGAFASRPQTGDNHAQD